MLRTNVYPEPNANIFPLCPDAPPQTFDSGDIEYKFLGPHQDQRKTKELQDQGKKINLSLSEVQTWIRVLPHSIHGGP